MSVETEDVESLVTFQPKTPLGKRLWKLRQEIVASGDPLLDIEGIRREVLERRGGIDYEDEMNAP